MNDGAHELVRDAVREVVRQRTDIQLVVLFGSRARGNARPESDVDLGILPAQGSELGLTDELALQAMLERRLDTPVDLVRLDRTTPAIRWRAARDGVRVHGSLQAFCRFRTYAAIEHDDLRPTMDWALRRFREIVAKQERA